MLTRTWAFGTQIKAKVKVFTGTRMMVLEDEHGEGYVLFGSDHDVEPKEGDTVTMEFCKGGPTGGHWKIVAIEESAQ